MNSGGPYPNFTGIDLVYRDPVEEVNIKPKDKNMTDTDILKYAVQRELELTKKRTLALARQNWNAVNEAEICIEELQLLRKKLADDAVKQINSGNPGV